MGGQFYDNALQTVLEDAATDYSGSAAPITGINGPAGRYGRILDLTLIVTTAFTVADTLVDIGENGGDTDAQLDGFTLAFTGSAIGDRLFPTRDNSTVALPDGVDINPDVTTDFASDQGSTAGAADTQLFIAWW